jgi:hypothetical protein
MTTYLFKRLKYEKDLVLSTFMRIALFLLIALAVLGVVATTTTFMIAPNSVNAQSCIEIIAGCHGCAPGFQGDIKSGGKCFNN